MCLVLSLARLAHGQAPAPDERQEEEDDLQVPAAPAPPSAPAQAEASGTPDALPPPEPQPQPPVAPVGTPSAAAPAPAPPPPPATGRAPEVRADAPAASSPAAEGAEPALPLFATSNLERGAHSQPIPRGLVLGGYVQSDFRASAVSEDQIQQSGQLLNEDRFAVRRARLRLDRGWEYVSGTLELDASTVNGVNVGVRRAEGSLFYRGSNPDTAAPLFVVTVGATDLPFGYELVESARSRFFTERSLASSALFPTEADVGIKVWGAAGFLRYALALTNGEPLNRNALPTDPNAAKDLTGRVGAEVAPSPAFAISGGTSFALGKGFHPGQPATKDSVIWRDDDGNGSVSLAELVGVPGSAASPSSNFDRWVLGLDVQLGFVTPLGRTRIAAEAFVATNYDRGFAIADPVASGLDVRHAGAYVSVVQDVTRYGVVGLRASFYDPNSDVLEERRGRLLPREQAITTIAPLLGLVLRDRARLLLQYDIVRDELGRDSRGVPKDADNDQLTARLQVEL